MLTWKPGHEPRRKTQPPAEGTTPRAAPAAATVQGVLQRETLLRVSDAGTYFVDQTTELFCDQPLIGILDLQHSRQHVWEAGRKVVGDPRKTAAWVAPRTQAIWDGHVDDVITPLMAPRRALRSGMKPGTAQPTRHF